MFRKSFLEILSVDERRMVRSWTWGVLAFYGSLTLVVVTAASFIHRPFDGAHFVAKTNSAPIAAQSNNAGR